MLMLMLMSMLMLHALVNFFVLFLFYMVLMLMLMSLVKTRLNKIALCSTFVYRPAVIDKYRVYQKKVYTWKKSANAKSALLTLVILSSTASFGTPSNIFLQHYFFLLKGAGYKNPLFKIFAHRLFVWNGFWVDGVKMYGLCFIRLESFRHFGASTINRWELKNHFTG